MHTHIFNTNMYTHIFKIYVNIYINIHIFKLHEYLVGTTHFAAMRKKKLKTHLCFFTQNDEDYSLSFFLNVAKKSLIEYSVFIAWNLQEIVLIRGNKNYQDFVF